MNKTTIKNNARVEFLVDLLIEDLKNTNQGKLNEIKGYTHIGTLNRLNDIILNADKEKDVREGKTFILSEEFESKWNKKVKTYKKYKESFFDLNILKHLAFLNEKDFKFTTKQNKLRKVLNSSLNDSSINKAVEECMKKHINIFNNLALEFVDEDPNVTTLVLQTYIVKEFTFLNVFDIMVNLWEEDDDLPSIDVFKTGVKPKGYKVSDISFETLLNENESDKWFVDNLFKVYNTATILNLSLLDYTETKRNSYLEKQLKEIFNSFIKSLPKKERNLDIRLSFAMQMDEVLLSWGSFFGQEFFENLQSIQEYKNVFETYEQISDFLTNYEVINEFDFFDGLSMLPQTKKEITRLMFERLNGIENSPLGGVNGFPLPSQGDSIDEKVFETLMDLPYDKVQNKTLEKEDFLEKVSKTHIGLKDVATEVLYNYNFSTFTKSQKTKTMLFVGPAGVGKTSLAKTLGETLGKKFDFISLSGLNDVSYLKGFPRTYKDSKPGVIVEKLKQAGTNNLVLVLDEVDKAGSKNGKAEIDNLLLSLLDSSQNFEDSFLELGIDTSQITFILTANSTKNLSSPLLNRCEVINFSPYTSSQKIEILEKNIIPSLKNDLKSKFSKEHSKNLENFFNNKKLHKKIEEEFVHDHGVRDLKKIIEKIISASIVENQEINEKNIENILKFNNRFKKSPIRKVKNPGVFNALYTVGDYSGGTTQVSLLKTRKATQENEIQINSLTGDQLTVSTKNVLFSMEEAYGDLFKDPIKFYLQALNNWSKIDGPSMGIGIATSLYSILTNQKIKMNVAFTGEVDIHGDVRAIGGLDLKILNSYGLGIDTYVISTENYEEGVKILKDNGLSGKIKLIPLENVSEIEGLTEIFEPMETTMEVKA